ncbi:GNAT family N-acetyltransferase [Ascidiimonas sp. W6]|uniref:GNAT family N-acetyltransferase n=1 Tax=Ascidiimonas meishanensis TaxID=3128903 RepID=UPI0030EDB3D4
MKIKLETTRLLLRPFAVEDSRDLYEMNTDLEVVKYTGDSPFSSIEKATELIEFYDQYEKYKMGRLSVIRKSDNKFLGWCGLKYHPKEKIVDLGYRFYRKYWGHGYATEAAEMCLQYGFNKLALTTIHAHVHEQNNASQKVLEKCRFKFLKKILYDKQPAKLYILHKKDFIKKNANESSQLKK